LDTAHAAMTLTTALSLLAVVVLLAVVLQGWWRTRRAAPARARAASKVLDARGQPRVEPALGPVVGDDGTAEAPLTEAGDTRPGGEWAAQATADADADPLPAPRAHLRPVPRLDALIDAIVPLALEAPVSGEAVLAHLPPTRRAGSKPFYIEGLDTETGDWAVPVPGRRYGELQAGVQLANRSGPLNEIEYSEFLQKLETFAEALGASVRADEVPDMLEVVARARELDGMTSPLDAQLTITLRANGVAWSVAYVQQIVARLGFVPASVAGRWVLPAAEEHAPPVLSLSVDAHAALAALDAQGGAPQASAVREAVLVLDAPQTPEAAEPYPAWHHAARTLADDLDATAVDDQGHPISVHAFATIGREVQQLYRQLQALDLAAGSAAARRLFS
jgi:hypothetical protein